MRESGKGPAQLAIISFQAATIAEAKRSLPEIPAYFLASFKQDKETGAWTPPVEELIDRAKSIGADGLDLSYAGPLDRTLVQRVKAAGLKPLVWTLDDAVVARKLIAWGVEGITTNRAGWLRQQLSGTISE